MKPQALTALTALNLAGLLALAAAYGLGGSPSASLPADAERLAALEARLARVEAQAASPVPGPLPGPVDPAASAAAAAAAAPPTASGAGQAPAPPGPAGPPAAAAAAGSADPAPDAPVTRGELAGLVEAHLTRREATARQRWQAAAARPKRPLADVARQLGLDARQETAVRQLYRQLERDSLGVLFEVDESGLELLKAQLAQAEHDPRLKAELRERIAVNWTRRQSEIGVLWVKLDARLREQLGPELLARFYRFDVQLEQREFPDIQAMFFPQPAPDEPGAQEPGAQEPGAQEPGAQEPGAQEPARQE